MEVAMSGRSRTVVGERGQGMALGVMGRAEQERAWTMTCVRADERQDLTTHLLARQLLQCCSRFAPLSARASLTSPLAPCRSRRADPAHLSGDDANGVVEDVTRETLEGRLEGRREEECCGKDKQFGSFTREIGLAFRVISNCNPALYVHVRISRGLCLRATATAAAGHAPL